MNGIIGRKVGMTQVFDETGRVIPVTVIEAGPCFVTQVKAPDSDGYSAIQLGFDDVEPRKLNLPQRGHLKPVDRNLRVLREFRVTNPSEYEVGQCLKADVFYPGQRVDVIGRSKGRGFAGVIKRHGFASQNKTHGQTDRERAPGAIGACNYPGRVWKGKKMPGHMGSVRKTVQNLLVIEADPERNLLLVRGGVPGANGELVLIQEGRKQ
ncbi:MAG: 50S ribosomal protein L3 [Anaerolineae bacterium]|jgi:large subunit ribosomal protein L3|nr:50S ribosomal protein L3 [Anaerolineae bacterium]